LRVDRARVSAARAVQDGTYNPRVGEFMEQTLARVPPGFELGEPLRLLLEWTEAQGYVGAAHDGDLYGVLDGRHLGPAVSIAGYSREKTSSFVGSWFGDVDDNPSSWLWPFAEEPERTALLREWVEQTFNVSVPRTASEIVRHPAEMGDEDTPDPFCRLISRLTS